MEAVEVLSKVTGLTQGLFNEISSKTRGMLTQKIFECQAESDEYEVLLNQKNEVLQIKNAYTTWDKEIIRDLLNPPVQSAPVQSQFTQPSVATPPPQPKLNYPAAITIPQINYSNISQYIADFVKLNPGCIYSLFDPNNPNCVNESLCHSAQVWEFSSLENGESYSSNNKIFRFDFRPNSGDTSIDEQVMAMIEVDPSTMQIISIEIEG